MFSRTWPKAIETYTRYTPVIAKSASNTVLYSVDKALITTGYCVTKVLDAALELSTQPSSIVGDIKLDYSSVDDN